ncbi:MAG: Grx4 family monothiol glutaredoxin [Candidatus Jidaibacter sp.]|jgi:monothiol glutaredoxin|nr:Grx4 family monothiol glutaredoxin [Candidatus Jidaibacter sp.]
MSNPIFSKIAEDISNNDVVLYMKGTADTPMCGFSGAVVMILKRLGVSFKDVNVLENNEIREGIKQFTSWPTIPQLYIKGEFIGGCDIVKEMFESGELARLLESSGIKHIK